jgi:hypothetical protein
MSRQPCPCPYSAPTSSRQRSNGAQRSQDATHRRRVLIYRVASRRGLAAHTGSAAWAATERATNIVAKATRGKRIGSFQTGGPYDATTDRFHATIRNAWRGPFLDTKKAPSGYQKSLGQFVAAVFSACHPPPARRCGSWWWCSLTETSSHRADPKSVREMGSMPIHAASPPCV